MCCDVNDTWFDGCRIVLKRGSRVYGDKFCMSKQRNNDGWMERSQSVIVLVCQMHRPLDRQTDRAGRQGDSQSEKKVKLELLVLLFLVL
jgi:hypothetical protein